MCLLKSNNRKLNEEVKNRLSDFKKGLIKDLMYCILYDENKKKYFRFKNKSFKMVGKIHDMKKYII